MYKKLLLVVLMSFILVGEAFCQQEKGIYGIENWLSIWTDFNPADTEYNAPTQILSGNITTDTRLHKKDTYLLLGNVFVTDSAQLTIDPGTVILGDHKSKGALIITRGAKILADGTQTDPIVFTSNSSVKKKGDWGGVFILGDAPVNKKGDAHFLDYGLKPSAAKHTSYGGNNVKSNSGIFNYVRIEYAGKRTKKYGYFSGLTLAGVGNETLIQNVMVTYSEGSSFSVIGGETNLSQLVSFRSRKNDFVFNYGAQATLTNSLGIKSPYFTASGGASSIYLASYDTIEEIDPEKKATNLYALNLTLLNLSDDLQAAMNVGLVNEALFVDEGATFSISKSVFSGFNPAVILDDRIRINDASLQAMVFRNMYFNNCKGNIFVEGKRNNEDLENWYGNSLFQNVYSKGSDSETFIDPNNLDNPDFRLRINKIIASNLPDED